MDLLLIVALSIILLPLALVTTGAARIVLGVLFVLFFPGYTLVAALFPARNSIGRIERLALSFGLSIAVVPLIGLGLNYTPWGIRLTTDQHRPPPSPQTHPLVPPAIRGGDTPP